MRFLEDAVTYGKILSVTIDGHTFAPAEIGAFVGVDLTPLPRKSGSKVARRAQRKLAKTRNRRIHRAARFVRRFMLARDAEHVAAGIRWTLYEQVVFPERGGPHHRRRNRMRWL